MKVIDKKIIDILKDNDGEVKTTKFFKENGLSQYNIASCVDLGYLEKVSHGKYKILYKKREEEKNDYSIIMLIKKLYLNVNSKNFYEVYTIAKHICEDKIDNKFDKVLYLVFSLLYNIIGSNYDYRCASSLVFDKNGITEYEKLIYEHNYSEASTYLDSLINMMKSNNIAIKDDIFMFKTLVDAAKEKVINGDNIQIRKDNMNKYYRLFIQSLRARNHKKSLEYIEKSINYCDDDGRLNLLTMMKEINLSFLQYLNNGSYDIKRKDSYEQIKNLTKSFRSSIMEHDYYYSLYLIEAYSLNERKAYKTFGYMLSSLIRLSGHVDDYIAFRNELNKANGLEKVENVLIKEGKKDSENSRKSKIIISTPESLSKEIKENVSEVKVEVEKENIEDTHQNSEKLESYKISTNPWRYKTFLMYFNNGEYDDAYESLRYLISDDHESDEYKLYIILGDYINMRDKKVGFEDKNITYDEADTRSLFDAALLNRDYRIALRNIGKLTYHNNDEFLNILKTILHNMNNLEKKYGVKKEEKKEQEKEQEKVVLKEEKQLDSEQPDKYSYNELLYMVSIKEFDKLYENLKNGFYQHKLDRLELNVFRLIEILQCIRNDKLIINENKKIEYDGNYFRCLYEAIRYHQVDEIIRYFDLAYQNAYDKKELDVMGEVIDSISLEYDELMNKRYEEERKAEIIASSNSKIKELIQDKKELTLEEIDYINNLLQDKADAEPNEAYLESCILMLIETIIANPQIDASYFLDLSKDTDGGDNYNFPVSSKNQNNIDERIEELFQAGDFIRAYSLIYETPFNKCLLKYSYDNRLIIRNMLSIFMNILNTPVDYSLPVDYEKQEKKAIQSRMKKNDFLGAYENILSSTHIDKDTLSVLAANVLVSFIGNSIMENSCEEDFLDALDKKDLDRARIALINYKEVLDRSSYGKVSEYQDKYKEMNTNYENMKKRMLK